MDLWTVTEVTRYIKELLDSNLALGELWIAGEISNWSKASSGHRYFTLKDDNAEIPCVMWRNAAARLAFEPAVGDWVQGFGSVSVYERGGKYQFYAALLQRAGVGVFWESFLALKDRLEQEGLFDLSRKREPPPWPHRIGLVTSPTGAALRDILNVLNERFPAVEVVLSPSLVQGGEAPMSLCRALDRLYAEPKIDVILLARGGGSMEDLWPFNDEGLARTIVRSPVPVVTGIGHETDHTIADLVADFRAPTPSAAAAAVVPDASALMEQVLEKRQRIRALAEGVLQQRGSDLSRVQRRLDLQTPQRRVNEMWQQLDDATRGMARAARHRLGAIRAEFDGRHARLAALDPSTILRRGYAAIEDATTGRPLARASEASVGQRVDLRLQDGRLEAIVSAIDVASSRKAGSSCGS
jgi:exodeoxyribonuclease VII large subunit